MARSDILRGLQSFERSFAPNPLMLLHREMNRLLEDALMLNPRAGGGGTEAEALPAAASIITPRMDVEETDNALRITADLPGVNENDVEVTIDDDTLTIRAEPKLEREEERRDIHLKERAYGVFQRSIRLPFAAEPDQVQARFDNGVLTIAVPKTPAQQRSHQVRVEGRGARDGDGDGDGQATREGRGEQSAPANGEAQAAH